LFLRQLNCKSIGGLKKNFDSIKMHGMFVKNIQVAYVHKRLTVNGILKDCVKKKGLITDGS
jgi:hypothetical protein